MSINQNNSLMSQRLLLSIAEQMKLPLQQVARRAELGAMGQAVDFMEMKIIAENAIQLIEGYSLGLRLSEDNYGLVGEAVSVASVLYDANQQLMPLAKLYNVSLEMNIAGKFGPVLVHKKGLTSAIVGLAGAIIEAIPAQELDGRKPIVQLATHRCRYGIVAGVYADIPGLNSEALSRGRKLYGISRQPLVNITQSSGSGIFVADAIFRSMKLRMQISRHHNLEGLGVVMQPSPQLVLV